MRNVSNEDIRGWVFSPPPWKIFTYKNVKFRKAILIKWLILVKSVICAVQECLGQLPDLWKWCIGGWPFLVTAKDRTHAVRVRSMEKMLQCAGFRTLFELDPHSFWIYISKMALNWEAKERHGTKNALIPALPLPDNDFGHVLYPFLTSGISGWGWDRFLRPFPGLILYGSHVVLPPFFSMLRYYSRSRGEGLENCILIFLWGIWGLWLHW